MSNHRLLKFVLLSLLFIACSGERGRRDTGTERTSVRYNRSIGVQEVLLKSKIACSDGTIRAIGDSTTAQMITFATSGDCLACGTHSVGLDSIRISGALAVDFFTIAYAPEPQMPQLQLSLAARSSNAICFDPSGKYWRAHDLSRTPVTVLVVHGRIAHVHDTQLDTDFARAAFVDAIRRKM